MPSNNSEERNKRIQGMIDGFNMTPLTPDTSVMAARDHSKELSMQVVDELRDLEPDMLKRVMQSLTPEERKLANSNALEAIRKKKAFMESFQGVAINAINSYCTRQGSPEKCIKTKIK